MDIITQKFFATAARLRRELQEIKNHLKAARETYETRNEQPHPPPIIRGELNRSQSEIDEEAGRHATQERYQNRNLVLQAAGAIITLIIALATFWAAGAARDAARASEQQAKAAWKNIEITSKNIELTVSNFQSDQRAWVGTSDQPVAPTKDERGAYTLGVVLKNTGKTPAFDVRNMVNNDFQPANKPFVPKWWCAKNDPKTKSIVLLQPGASYRVLTHNPPLFPNCGENRATNDVRNRFNDNDALWYVYGWVTYEDVFKCPHWTHFCEFRRAGEMQKVYACETYNDADRNNCAQQQPQMLPDERWK